MRRLFVSRKMCGVAFRELRSAPSPPSQSLGTGAGGGQGRAPGAPQGSLDACRDPCEVTIREAKEPCPGLVRILDLTTAILFPR